MRNRPIVDSSLSFPLPNLFCQARIFSVGTFWNVPVSSHRRLKAVCLPSYLTRLSALLDIIRMSLCGTFFVKPHCLIFRWNCFLLVFISVEIALLFSQLDLAYLASSP